jgi:hypothetical protein
MTRAYIAEYGGLGANLDNVYAFGTSCVYDSQGNLFVMGAASAAGTLPGNPIENNIDSLLLKYGPNGTLLFHKTWWDENNMNCGATNVALDIDNQDRIVWLANSWGTSGCWYGWMDTNGDFGLGGIAQTAAGINQTHPSDISSNNNGAAVISSSWNYSNPDTAGHPGDSQDIPAVISIPNIIASGTPGFTTGFAGYNTDGSLGSGVFNAVVIDEDGYSYAIGNFTIDGVTNSLLVGLRPDGTVMWQYTLYDNVGTGVGIWGESLALAGGYLYTVINDRDTGPCHLGKYEITHNGIGNVWRAIVSAAGVGPQGFDINFDAVGHVILTGILATNIISGGTSGYLYIAKFHHDTGATLFFNSFYLGAGATAGGGESMFDLNGASYLAGHRVASVYQDRIAVSCMTVDDLTDTSTSYDSRVLVAQVPTDGSLAQTSLGPSQNSPAYVSLAGAPIGATVDTHTPQATTFTVVDLSADILYNFDTVTSETTTTDVLGYSNTEVTLGTFGAGGIRLKPGMKLRSGVRIVASRGGISIDEGLLTEDGFVLVTEDNVYALEQEISNTQAVLYGDYVILTDDDLVITDDNDRAIVQDI